MEPERESSPCCFDEWAANSAARARKRGVGAPITRYLLEAVERQGIAHRSFLDVGCGTGDLALGALERGAARASGVDLGPGAIDQARALASERGLADRATFRVADGAIAPLDRHDVVALNRVLCCYPDVTGLLANSLGAVDAVYAYTAPIHTGLLGTFNRVSVGISNAWFRLRDRKFRGFRAFVHDLDEVDRIIADAGFRKTIAEHRRIWQLAVFSRV